jgi:predicted amidophosphoribosyltransferase
VKAIKSEFREKPACAEKDAPLPESIVCSGCGQDIEIWSDEEQTACSLCGKTLGR